MSQESGEATSAIRGAAHNDAQSDGGPSPLESQTISQRIAALRMLTAFAAVALIVATWPLWWPLRDFPQVSLVAWASRTTLSIDMTCAVLLLLALAVALVAELRMWRRRSFGHPGALPNSASRSTPGRDGKKPKPGSAGRGISQHSTKGVWAAIGVLLAVLMLLSQHRIQAWAYQFLLLSVVFAACRNARTWTLARWIFASIYVHSALGKFDFSFQHTLGTQFIQGGLEMLPAALAAQMWPPADSLPNLALIFPTTELIIGLLLLCRHERLRRSGVFLSVAMHLSLLTILGPWGLSHHSGVLLWNGYFLLATPVIFWSRTPDAPPRAPEKQPPTGLASGEAITLRATCATAIVLVSLVLPFGSRAGLWDHWPSWGLYSPSNPRTLFWIAAPAAKRLPESLRAHLRTTDDPLWMRMSLSSLSLERVGAPLYPQDRFQLGVALQLARQLEIQRDCRFGLQSSADRWTGDRATELGTYEQALGWAGKFRLNAFPRQPKPALKRRASRDSIRSVAKE